MSFKKNYYERKQLVHRKQFGKLEKRNELLSRLRKIKDYKTQINEAKEEIKNVTKHEYFFKYNSLKNKSNKLFKEEVDTMEDLKKKSIYINYEILRVENKLKQFSDLPKGKKFIFNDDGEMVEVIRESVDCINSELIEYKKYLADLLDTKKKLSNQIVELSD